MNALLPHVVEHAVRARTAYGATQSFGAVVLVVLLLLLIEWEAVRMIRGRSDRWILLTLVSIPLLIVVALDMTARLAPIIP